MKALPPPISPVRFFPRRTHVEDQTPTTHSSKIKRRKFIPLILRSLNSLAVGDTPYVSWLLGGAISWMFEKTSDHEWIE